MNLERKKVDKISHEIIVKLPFSTLLVRHLLVVQMHLISADFKISGKLGDLKISAS